MTTRGFTYTFTPDLRRLRQDSETYEWWDGRMCLRGLSTEYRRVLAPTPIRAYINVETDLDAEGLLARIQADPLHADERVLGGAFEDPFDGLTTTRIE